MAVAKPRCSRRSRREWCVVFRAALTPPPSHGPPFRPPLSTPQDLAQYVNEVKRDNETLREIRQFQLSIENLVGRERSVPLPYPARRCFFWEKRHSIPHLLTLVCCPCACWAACTRMALPSRSPHRNHAASSPAVQSPHLGALTTVHTPADSRAFTHLVCMCWATSVRLTLSLGLGLDL